MLIKYILLILFLFLQSNAFCASLTYDFTSPDVNSHQGYTFDGTHHYTIDTLRIDKRLNDASWTITAQNTLPFSGISGNHLGDGDVSGGFLYIPGETYVSCSEFSNQQLLIFNASDLARVDEIDISAQAVEVAGVAVVSSKDRIYAVSYCDSSKIFEYKLSDYSYVGSITLSPSLTFSQGITYDNIRNVFYIATNDGTLHKATMSGVVSDVGTSVNYGANANEGLKYYDNRVRWLYDSSGVRKVVYYFTESISFMKGVLLKGVTFQ